MKRKKIIRNSKCGMEMVQVGILIAIAIVLGLIFKEELIGFVDGTFGALNSSDFSVR